MIITSQKYAEDAMQTALEGIVQERQRQDEKWGQQNHDDYRWLAILTEEIGEVSQAALQTEFGGKHAGEVYAELVQLAAVALAWLECIERRNYDSNP